MPISELLYARAAIYLERWEISIIAMTDEVTSQSGADNDEDE